MSTQTYVRTVTRLQAAPFVPEVVLHLGEDIVGLWERTEAWTGRPCLAPPFWAFAWAGGLGLARYVLDHPGAVRDRDVLDLATGCGVVAVAAALAGAARVTVNDVDPLALAAAQVNALANDVRLDVLTGDLLAPDTGTDTDTAPDTGTDTDTAPDTDTDADTDTDTDTAPDTGTAPDTALDTDPVDGPGAGPAADVVLVGDVFYDRDLAASMLPFLQRAAERGARVLVGDPGRRYLPRSLLLPLARYDVPVSVDLESTDVATVTVWWLPARSEADG